MTTDPHLSIGAGSCWARRVPGFPRFDRDFRVAAVHTKDGVTYVETERLDTGGWSRGLLDDVLAHATRVGPPGPVEPQGGPSRRNGGAGGEGAASFGAFPICPNR